MDLGEDEICFSADAESERRIGKMSWEGSEIVYVVSKLEGKSMPNLLPSGLIVPLGRLYSDCLCKLVDSSLKMRQPA